MLSGLVVVALGLAIFPAATGTTPVSIKTNSMQAELPAGSLAYIRPQDAYELGDVVTFSVNGEFVTHKLVGHPDSQRQFGKPDLARWVTKGSSNAEPDPWTVPTEEIKGKVLYFIPWAGTALRVLSFPVVWAFLGLLALTFWLASRGPNNPMKENRTMDENRDDIRQPDEAKKLDGDTETVLAAAEGKDTPRTDLAEARIEGHEDEMDVEPGAVPARSEEPQPALAN